MSLSSSAFNVVDSTRDAAWRRAAKFSRASWTRQKMSADRRWTSCRGNDQVHAGRLPHGKSFRGDKVTLVFLPVPEADQRSFAQTISSYVIIAWSSAHDDHDVFRKAGNCRWRTWQSANFEDRPCLIATYFSFAGNFETWPASKRQRPPSLMNVSVD
jgi:hypothetical protein